MLWEAPEVVLGQVISEGSWNPTIQWRIPGGPQENFKMTLEVPAKCYITTFILIKNVEKLKMYENLALTCDLTSD